MKLRARIALTVLIFTTAWALAIPVRSQTPARAPFAEDRGQFEISVDGKQVGTEEFSVAHDGAGWVAHGTTEFHTANSAGRVTGELHVNAAGAPLRYEWNLEGTKKITSKTTFDGNEAKMSTDIGQKTPIEQDFMFASPVVILDNNLYDQYGVLARLYNWSTRGPQNFAVLIPQEHQPGNITVEATGPTSGNNQQLRVHTSDLDVLLTLDSSHRLMRISVPSSKAEIVRK
jgi:hypothetical protein